ncbi:hypothetical protein BOX15_Mlig029772g1, partial [Macrostomum lignano]
LPAALSPHVCTSACTAYIMTGKERAVVRVKFLFTQIVNASEIQRQIVAHEFLHAVLYAFVFIYLTPGRCPPLLKNHYAQTCPEFELETTTPNSKNMPRPHRFKESSSAPQSTDLLACAFLSDRQLEERMVEMRRCIVNLRQRWDSDRQQQAKLLLRWLETEAENRPQAEAPPESEWPLVLNRWRDILAVDRNWADLRDDSEEFLKQFRLLANEQLRQQFSVLREYTDNITYSLVFRKVLQAFRTRENSEAELMVYVYLIELINIDLFNYTQCGLAPSCERSCVYRGLTMSSDHWLSFKRVFSQPVNARFVAVPLALTSASRSIDVAMQFMLKESAKNSTDSTGAGPQSADSDVPCLQAIHVIGVPDRLMELYRRRFPQSVVSTICAVDVAGVSAHPEEQEVLLRGAFYQLLGMQESQQLRISAGGESPGTEPRQLQLVTANILEILMVNANRDHLSNGRLGDQDAPARALFATIVRIARYEYCLRICRERGLATDESQYAAALSQAESELQKLLA